MCIVQKQVSISDRTLASIILESYSVVLLKRVNMAKQGLMYLLLLFALVVVANSQAYPQFEFRSRVLPNNSYIFRRDIGEGVDNSLRYVTDYSSLVVLDQVWGIGMMKKEWKSTREQVDTSVICMSPEEREWSISIAEYEDYQECGDVIYLIALVLHRVSTSTLAQE